MKASNLSVTMRTRPKNPGALARAETDPLASERRTLKRLGFEDATICAAETAARHNATTIEQELLANGAVSPEAYYRRLAFYLGLPFVPKLDVTCVIDRPRLDRLLVTASGLRLEDRDGNTTFAVVPRAAGLAELHRRLARRPALRRAVVITTPSTIRHAVWHAGARRRLITTIHRLMAWEPRFSARIVFWGKQGFLLGGGVASFFSGLALFPAETLLATHILFTALYFLTLLVRLAALRMGPPAPTRADADDRTADETPPPVYTVMVALYHEANMVPQLVSHLKKLNWPASKLDIKLVCEADDHETIATIETECLPPQFELVTVPPAAPRTKPKALDYALSGARENSSPFTTRKTDHTPTSCGKPGSPSKTGPQHWLACRRR
nr:hypothetical protein [Marinicella sp. W31]MDC2879120.1 hypothetical protein [Marinicella sp. W31]